MSGRTQRGYEWVNRCFCNYASVTIAPDVNHMRERERMSTNLDQAPNEQSRRRAWMETLAKAPVGSLSAFWKDYGPKPAYEMLRRPEVGLVMVQGRVGGTGRAFNLGEMTLTRCSVTLESGLVGHAYVAGRRPERAELAAVLDALLQDPAYASDLNEKLIHPLELDLRQKRHEKSCRAAASKVDFFTMVRGDD